MNCHVIERRASAEIVRQGGRLGVQFTLRFCETLPTFQGLITSNRPERPEPTAGSVSRRHCHGKPPIT